MKGTEFHVLLGDIKLSPESEMRIEQGIQSLVMSELLSYKPNPDDPYPPKRPRRGTGPYIVVPPIPWPGYLLRYVKDMGLVKEQFAEMEDLAKKVNVLDKMS